MSDSERTTSVAPVAELRDVTFSFNGPPVLDRVSLRIEQRDFVGIIGPNGGGKTTLLKIMLGLLEPTSGTVRVLDTSLRRARRHIGYVPQHARIDLAAPATALDVVLMGRLARSSWGFRYGRPHIDAAVDAMRQTECADLASRPLRTLSGGQRQRVLIARALASDARLLLLDEPTTGVDQERERQFIDLLHRLNEQLPLVMVSHDVAFVSSHVKHVACLNRRLFTHPAGEVTEERIAQMYGEHMLAVHHHDHDGEGER